MACLAHTARMQARDDLAEMLCKRVASILKKAKAELEEIRLRQRAVSERLIGTYRTVLENLDPDGEAAAQEPGQAARAVAAVEEAGGFAAQLSDIEEVSAYHGDNYEVLVHRFFRMDRAVMFELAGKLDLVATSSDASVLAALEHARAYHAARRDHIPLPPAADGEDADSGIAFASGTGGARSPTGAAPAWWSGGTSRRWCSPTWPRNCAPGTSRSRAPGSTPTGARTCCPGKNAAAAGGILRWAGLPATAAGFTERLRHAHLDAAAALDAGYEDNADLVIGEDGVPSLKRRRSAGTPEAAEKLAEAVAGGCRSGRCCRSWPVPPTGSAGTTTSARRRVDPKIADPLGRYCMAVFTGGANIGP